MTTDTATRAPALSDCAPEQAGFSAEKLTAIAAHFEGEVAKGELPNAAFALARHGRVFYRHHLGYADLATRRPVEDDSIYRLLSLTKGVTGVAVMTLLDAGLVQLSDPIAKYIPEFAEMQVMTPDGLVRANRQITIVDLLSHTSGLTSGFMPGPLGDLYLEHGLQEGTLEAQQPALADYVRKLASMPLLVQPGAEFNYSEGMAVLGRMIEVVTGKRYGDYLHDTVFAPLGMRDAAFFVPAKDHARLVSLYGYADGRGLHEYEAMAWPKPEAPVMRPLQVLERPGADLGGAGLVGTVDDVLRFAAMLAGGGQLDGVRVLEPETVKLMSVPRVRAQCGDAALVKVPFEARGYGMDMGLTMSIITDPARADSASSAGSFGFGGSAGTRFWADPKLGIAGVFFTQRMSCPPEPFAAFQRLAYGAMI